MRRDAAWRLRMTNGSRVSILKSGCSRGVVVGMPMSCRRWRLGLFMLVDSVGAL